MMKYVVYSLLWSFCMNAASPFSFKEINAVAEFDLVQPHFLVASDGVKLAYYSFVKSDSKNIVILYSGAGLYGNQTYQWVAKTLHEKYNVGAYIFDIRGHGYSEGARGDALSIEQAWNDVDTALAFIKAQHTHAKLYLAGHSSGAGLLINHAAHVTKQIADGYIFIAPYLGPQSGTIKEHQNPEKSFIKKVRSWVYVAGHFFPHSFITHLKSVFFNYPDSVLKADPLIVPFYTYAMSCATTPYEVSPLFKKITKPVAFIMGDADEQFIPEKVLAYKTMINAPVDTQLIKGAGHLSILLDVPKAIADYFDL